MGAVVEQTRLADLLSELNAHLDSVTPYKLAIVDPRELVPAERNAHYMSKATFDRLTANVQHDGNLASLPFCWKTDEARFVILSGHHRVMAAVAAGVLSILVLYTDAILAEDERVATQLSHNAIVGDDNPTMLRDLWASIGQIDLKAYSGLDDKLMESLPKIDVSRIREEPLRFEELRILFVSSEIERIQDTLKRLGVATKHRHAARYEDFDRFFALLLRFKQAKGIVNTATAVMAMIEIIENWLAEHHATEQQ